MQFLKIHSEWSPELLKAIEWKTFESFCVELLRAAKFQAFRTPIGKDQGIDIFAYKNGNFEKPAAIAQCKAWATMKVGVKDIREFYGVMAANNVENGFYFVTGEYTPDALEFANQNKINIFDGEKILQLIKKAPQGVQDYLKKFLEMNNFLYPTCPTCNRKMLLRTSKKNNDERFWGCVNFPICKNNYKLSVYQ
jgi:restriction system protein